MRTDEKAGVSQPESQNWTMTVMVEASIMLQRARKDLRDPEPDTSPHQLFGRRG